MMNWPTSTGTMLCGNIQQTALPRAYRIKPARVTFRLPNFLARGHTAKMPMPMGMPPMADTIVWVMPSL